MKCQPHDGGISKKKKRCVYCGFSIDISKNILKQIIPEN